MSFSISQRSHEIALRTALGTNRKNVIVLVFREGIILAAIGFGVGLIGALIIGRMI